MRIAKVLVGIAMLICAILIVGTIYNLLFQTDTSEDSTEFLNPLFESFDMSVSGRIVFLTVIIVVGFGLGWIYRQV